MGKLGIWSRMAGRIRRGRRPADGDQDDGIAMPLSVDADGRPVAPPEGADSDDVAAADQITTALGRKARREHSLSKLQEGYDRVLELMDLMQKHMRVQEDRTEDMATALTKLSRSLADVPNVDQQQVQLLSTIAAQLETTTVRTQQLGDAIGELPRVVRQQTDTLSGIQRQLEMGAESDAHMSSALQSFGRGVDRLAGSTDKQVDALKDLRSSGDEHQRRLDEILQRQTRQFTFLAAMTAVLATAAIVAGTILLVLRLAG